MKLLPIALLAALAGNASAHEGVVDQFSPSNATWLLTDNPVNVWQQQVRVGIAGRLDAFELRVGGLTDSELTVRLRLGDGWNIGPVVWEGSYTKTVNNDEFVIFDVDHVGLHFLVGETFVIEAQGDGPSARIRGNHIDPAMGAPLYPEQLFLNGPGCYDDCAFRMRFKTWMNPSIGFNYCLQSENSTGAAALMTPSGSNSVLANDLVLTVGPAPVGQIGIVYYGPERTLHPAGDGFMCVAGGASGLARLPFGVVDGSGTLTAALDNLSPPNAQSLITSGSTWRFQAYYRDPAGGASGINFSDAVEIVFQP